MDDDSIRCANGFIMTSKTLFGNLSDISHFSMFNPMYLLYVVLTRYCFIVCEMFDNDELTFIECYIIILLIHIVVTPLKNSLIVYLFGVCVDI
ncbi:hypothetical protein AXX17_AT3G11450 [Arabidopsis thaliana]|uniref:Transmembrane protein n=1 Tax=Arabidopsis thaliana TaxID=3702 RepID=A0A178VC67_ARATH|nr:hypothetical protein AXX17_AT3G11450 [Arabidopsis thaliana]